MTEFWADKRVVVTGGTGFLGTYVVEKLKGRGCHLIVTPRSTEFDLRERDSIVRLYKTFRPHIVIHLAAIVGGIGANRKNPGRFFYENAIMGIQMMEYARQFQVKKFTAVGTICSYPKFTPLPFREEDIWNGFPEETNAPYGLAKKMMIVQAQAYRTQYNFNAINVLPVNLYGPRDNFHLETSHVIPALIRKCIEAKEQGAPEVILWGDGSPTREFLYVEDAAEGVIRATEFYDDAQPLNLGTGEEIAIRDLATMIAATIGFSGRFIWDATKPNGQPRRCLDTTKAKTVLGFYPSYRLIQGIPKTVAWFEKHLASKQELKTVKD